MIIITPLTFFGKTVWYALFLFSDSKKECINKRYLKSWIVNSRVKCIDAKYRLFRRYWDLLLSFEYYNRCKNIDTTMLKWAKQKYFKDRFDDGMDNSRKSWRLFKDWVNECRSKKKKDICKRIVGESTI